MGSHVLVEALPIVVRTVLKQHGYHRKDVSLTARESVSIAGGGGAKGQREYTSIVNLDSLNVDTHIGSWGGPNPFNPTNKVDLGDEQITLDDHTVVIKGSSGYRSFATVYMNPNLAGKFMPEPEEVSENEASILRAYGHLKSGPYRKEAIQRITNHQAIIDGLVARGMLKRAKNGATRITTKGRNAI